MALPKGTQGWFDFAVDALAAFASSEGAFVLFEAEAKLGEGDWVTQHFDPEFPPTYGIDPHMLHRARKILEARQVIVEDTVRLNGRPVSAWLDVSSLSDRTTAIERLAASKRRLYRSFLGWSGNAELCGHVAEEIVYASLRSLAGQHVWLPPGNPGNVSELLGRPITVGGPLDAAGACAVDPSNVHAGFVSFAVEVKNIRSVIYPWHQEVWDLLAKLADFPDVVPILIARNIHRTTFRCFKDIGALGRQTKRQWFHNRETARASIDLEAFSEVRRQFAFDDLVLVEEPDEPQSIITNFFSDVIHRDVNGRALIANQAERWEQVAPIVADFVSLREELSPDERRELWREFGNRIKAAGLYDLGQWAPNGTDVEP